MLIPNYKIECKIGQGGMAEVYLAEHIIMKRKVALKVMLSNLSQEKGFKESFLHEGEIIAQLEHPNIVRIHDINIVDDIYYMSMEYLSGGSLKEQLAQKKYNLPDCITLLEQVGAGLSLAHQRGYIHRDIKPANILFSKQGQAILTDFGIAKLQNTSSALTKVGYMSCTAQYMSPEQASSANLDQRSDVYNLGLVFYEMLVGEKVVGDKTDIQAIYCHTNEAVPKFPTEYEHLQPVLDKVLAKKPDERFETVQTFLDALLAAATDIKAQTATFEPTIQQPITPKPDLPSWVKPAALVATLGALLLAGGVYFTQSNRSDEANNAPQNIVTVTPTPSSPSLSPRQPQLTKTTNQAYQPHLYYTQLEQELDTLAQETQALLAIAPDNQQAQTTLNSILNRYHDLATNLLKTMNLPQARIVIDKGLQLSNQHKDLQTLKKVVERKPDTLSKKTSQQLRTLHQKAEKYLQAKRYTAPEGKNALEVYQNILIIDPQNQQAIDQIQQIIAIFERQIKSTMTQNTDEANELLNQVLAIAPFDKNLIQLQQQINATVDAGT